MTRILYAESFVEDADAIARAMESQFGNARADTFIAELNHFCTLIASQPRIAKKSHGYDTTLHGVVYGTHWIFLQHDAHEVRFVHMVDSRRLKKGLKL
jgi:plasmid stabilization system protein ParE